MSGEHQIPDSAHYRKGAENANCGSCVFFKDGICDVWDSPVEQSMVCDSYDGVGEEVDEYTTGDGDGPETDSDGLSELYFSNGETNEEDGLIWKTVLRTGTWAYRPGPGQRPTPIPLTVIRGHSTNPQRIVGLEDIEHAWNESAIEHATIPLSHADRTEDNTGFVRKLKVEDDPDREGHYVLRAGLEFTEPDIKQKILNGSIANTSVGLYYDYIRKDDGTKFPIALAHVALTNRPWINGMRPFGLSEDKVQIFEFAEDMSKETSTTTTTEFKLQNGMPTNPGIYSVPVTYTTSSTGSVELSFAPHDQWKQEKSEEESSSETPKKEERMAKVPGLEGLELAEDAAAVVAAALEAAQRAADEAKAQADALAAQNLALAEKEREREVEARIDELKGMGLSEQPGFLKVVREVLLSDNGSSKLQLSENESVTYTDIVNKLIDSLPKKDGKINFGEQAESLGVEKDEKPARDTTDENKKSDEERYREAHVALYGREPK